MNSNRAPRFKDKMTASEKFLFGLACTAAAFFTAIIQTCFFFNFRPFGFAPDLCLALTVACGIKFGPKCAGLVGLLSGFFLDTFSASGISLAIPFYILLGITVGIFSGEGSETNLPHIIIFIIGVIGGAAVSGFATTIHILLTYSSFIIGDVLFKTVFFEALCTVIFSFAVYPFAALVSKAVKNKALR